MTFLTIFRIQFKDLWFIFHDSSWSFRESYFCSKHILHKSKEWTEHKIMGFKPANKYQIIWQSLLSKISIIIIIFYRAKQRIAKTIQPFKDLFTIGFTLVQEKYFVKRNFEKKILSKNYCNVGNKIFKWIVIFHQLFSKIIFNKNNLNCFVIACLLICNCLLLKNFSFYAKWLV